jgi:hypothetical protein
MTKPIAKTIKVSDFKSIQAQLSNMLTIRKHPGSPEQFPLSHIWLVFTSTAWLRKVKFCLPLLKIKT